jgi:three-Cys-motif partner protein
LAKKVKKKFVQEERLPLDVFPEPIDPPILVNPLQHKLWTNHKANFIAKYILYFVLVTKHGTYIDGFAGPQDYEKLDAWTAKLVLELEPKWLKYVYLFELKKRSHKLLEKLKAAQPSPLRDKRGRRIKRVVEVLPAGDFNVTVHEFLATRPIKDKEATFCLLDQRTFECEWTTVKALADYKSKGYRKIELFYFLAVAWLDRSFAGQKDKEKLQRWWGNDGWVDVKKKNSLDRALAFVERFKTELGYRSAIPYPVYEKPKGRGKIMYYMIHATDHPEAPGLMNRAYEKAVVPETYEQLQLERFWTK